MNRPYVVCHMTMSIDGKVTGEFLRRPEFAAAGALYYEINRKYRADAFACGRVTMEESFTGDWYPDLNAYDSVCEREDYLEGERSGFYAVSFDPSGRLGWKTKRIVDADEDPGYDKAQIIEVLTHRADGRYLAYLRSLQIPYIFAGDDRIDIGEALVKLRAEFGINKLLLEGGSILNGAFQRAGMIDELSLVVDTAVAGERDKPLFADVHLENYRLVDVQNHEGVLWLNYKK